MTLSRQSTLLTWLAALAVAAVALLTGLASVEVERQTEEIIMAENTAKGAGQFRYLIMEAALRGETRTSVQWRQRVASFDRLLAGHRYSNAAERGLLARERDNLAVLARLYGRLGAGAPAYDTIGALFLTTQDMSDDAFELMRLNRADLEAAQRRLTLSILLSVVLLAGLIAVACLIIKRRVLRPIGALRHVMERVTAGELGLRLGVAARDEIGALACTFDLMTEQLAAKHARLLNEIEERRQAQVQLQHSVDQLAARGDELALARAELQVIIDNTPALVVYWDAQLCNRFANRAHEEWFGVTPAQMHGRQLIELLGAERFASIASQIRTVLGGDAVSFEQDVTLPSGQPRPAFFSLVPDVENGRVKGFYGFVSDISQLKQAQRQQAAALAQLRGVLAAAVDFAIIETDAAGTIRLFSAGAERLLGYSAAEVVGVATATRFHDDAELGARGAELAGARGGAVDAFDTLVVAARAGGSESREWTYVARDGTRLPVSLTVTAVRDADGAINGFLGVAKDISAERAATAALAAARDQAQAASVAKSQFLANMSHEIRTPMNAIIGMLQLLHHTDMSALQRDYAGKSQAAAKSLLGLLNDILDFSRVEAGKMTLEAVSFGCDALLRELSTIVSTLVGQKDVELLFELDPQLPPYLLGDPARLRQILLNLAGNAVKFTERGEVTISVRLVRREAGRNHIEFAVRDTGIGIPQAQLAGIFDEFRQAEASTTRRFGGTGLGLAISQRLVALMGGELSVRSRLGEGSTFSFCIALDDAARDNAAPHQPAAADLSVLVVDDNRSARDALCALVVSLGWRVASAGGGDEALALLAAAPPFDVLLIDWRMPGMDGWELAARVRADGGAKAAVVIMVSAHGRGELAERMAAERGMLNGFLSKPVTASMLVDAVMDAAIAPCVSPPCAGEARLAGMRLLVVDDNLVNQQVARGLLQQEGATVEVADGGQAGVRAALAAAPPFDAVLMDIQMPDMDGYEATRRLRRERHLGALPIIAMTANAMAGDRQRCLDAGMDEHIGKPIDVDALVAALLRHVKGAGPLPRAAAPATQAGPLLDADPDAIDLERALQRMGGNTVLYSSIVAAFHQESADLIPALRDALARRAREPTSCTPTKAARRRSARWPCMRTPQRSRHACARPAP